MYTSILYSALLFVIQQENDMGKNLELYIQQLKGKRFLNQYFFSLNTISILVHVRSILKQVF